MKLKKGIKIIGVFLLIIGILFFIEGVFAQVIGGSSTGVSSFSGGYSSFGGGNPSSIGYNNYGQEFSGNYRVYGSSVNPQFNNPDFLSSTGVIPPELYWPKFNQQDCFERQDIIMQIAPGGCSPAVVRSDLLEEQPVPVFCKVMALQVNPLIDISRIRSLYFTGNYPKGVQSIGYFPAQAAVRSQQNLVSSPLKDNLGYVVIVLSRVDKESEMPEFIGGTITASINYDVERAFGIGRTEFYINEMNDAEWAVDYKKYGFWNGKGYVRADSIDSNQATVSIYRSGDVKQSSVTLKKGETSKDIYLSGFYCAAGMNIRLESIDAPVDSALLQINDQQMWVAKGDRILDDKCTVSDLVTYGGGGKVSINCPVKNGRIDLSLNPGKARFSINGGSEKDYIVGEKIFPDQQIYLGYVGQDNKGARFAVLINDSYSYTQNEFENKEVYPVIEQVVNQKPRTIDNMYNDILSAVQRQYSNKLGSYSQKFSQDKVKVSIIKINDKTDLGVSFSDASVAKDRQWDMTNSEESLAKEYYDNAIKYYQDVLTLYPQEKMPILQEDPYAAQALYEAAQLSKRFQMNGKAQDFYNKLLSDYPNSDVAQRAIREKELLTKYDSILSKAIVYINNEQYFIDLLDFKKPSVVDLGAAVLINGKEDNLGLNEIRDLTGFGFNGTLQISEIQDDYITVKFYGEGINNILGPGSRGNSNNNSYYTPSGNYQTQRIPVNQDFLLNNKVSVRLIGVKLNKQAKIYITPKSFGPVTQSNFSFKIGIEKRGIKLSPQQTKDLMNNINKAIKDWSDANNKLGKVIEGLKAACFGTSTVLTVKNLLTGLSGESMARQQIMTNQGGWNDFCEKLINDGSASKFTGKVYAGLTVQKCLLDHNDWVNKDVAIYANGIKSTNEMLSQIQKQVGIDKTDILDFQGQVDAKKVDDLFKQKFQEQCKKNFNGNVLLPDREGTNVSGSDVCNWDTMTLDQRREMITLFSVRDAGGSSVLNGMVNKSLGKVALEGKNFYEYEGARKKAEADANKYNLNLPSLTPGSEVITFGAVKRITQGDMSNAAYKNFKTGDSVVRVFVPMSKSFGSSKPYIANPEIAGKEVIVKVNVDQFNKDHTPDSNASVYLVDGTPVSKSGSDSVREYMSLAGLNRIRQTNLKAFQNRMLSPEKLQVKYFERAPYKGLPSEVPFDVNDGWYVEMEYILSGFGKPYDESGRAVNYYICNVGPNGLIEFKKSSDDICAYINGQNSNELFPGMDSSESRRLITLAQSAISDAARQYGKKRVVINGRSFDAGISFGGENGRCSDFMSPADCNILFNVCDPVICPASRCDYGGRYKVDNVIQTGIVGSLMLCLPNFKEGVMIPICLSGVHAGIESYLSILNSTSQCLNESLATGKNIGICDEIESIYLCEFFWKQATPLLNVFIPRVLENVYSQGVRGGGEYTTVQNAWDNTQSAIKYFTNNYAVNSMLAFNKRSTDEVGGDICKSFMSVRYPNSKSFFDSLLEPDSPEQYTAWFSEDQLTTATIPATSHYKVYFHIYSGKDIGSYYVVYMKDLPESNYMYVSQTYVVDRGYINRGDQVDKALDFTAVSGYKQLCVSINGKDQCGFGKVSTSFLLNTITDQYAAEQIKTNIKSQQECVAGTPSLYSMLQPNLQAGAEQVVNPQLYNNGIIRVCATYNPGRTVKADGTYDVTNSTYDRWKEVGYCDDPTIKCWLDTSSVKNVIQDKQLQTQVLDQVNLNVLGYSGFMTEDESRAVANEGEKFIAALVVNKGDSKDKIENQISNIVQKLTQLSNVGTNNVHRARGLYLLGKLYAKVADGIKPELNNIKSSGNSNLDIQQAIDDNNIKITGIDQSVFNQNYRVIDGGTKYLKVYNLSGGNEYEVEVISIDPDTATVILLDDIIKKITVQSIGGKNRIVLRDTEGGTSVSPSPETNWDDSMLRENSVIRIYLSGFLGIGNKQITYRYSASRGWIANDNSETAFINMKLGYVKGMRELLQKSGITKVSIDGKDITYNSDKTKFEEQVFNALKK